MFSRVDRHADLLSISAGLITSIPADASNLCIRSLANADSIDGEGVSITAAQCSTVRKVCSPGGRIECTTLPRAVAMRGPAACGITLNIASAGFAATVLRLRHRSYSTVRPKPRPYDHPAYICSAVLFHNDNS
jgi:hypothetical protein